MQASAGRMIEIFNEKSLRISTLDTSKYESYTARLYNQKHMDDDLTLDADQKQSSNPAGGIRGSRIE